MISGRKSKVPSPFRRPKSEVDVQSLMDKMRVIIWMTAIALALSAVIFVKVFFY